MIITAIASRLIKACVELDYSQSGVPFTGKVIEYNTMVMTRLMSLPVCASQRANLFGIILDLVILFIIEFVIQRRKLFASGRQQPRRIQRRDVLLVSVVVGQRVFCSIADTSRETISQGAPMPPRPSGVESRPTETSRTRREATRKVPISIHFAMTF